MTNAASKLLVAGLLAVLPVSAESAGKIHVCVSPGNGTPMWVLIRAEALASRMFSTAGVGLHWHFADAAVCRELRQADTVRLDFVVNTPPGDHPGVLAYARVYEGTHIVLLFDRIETTAGIFQTSSVLAHVMTHEITHMLQGVVRHSEIGVMKAHWELKDLQRMFQHPLPFTPVDIELIQLGLARRAVRSASAAPVPTMMAPRSPITPFWNGASPSGSGESSNDRLNLVGNPNDRPKRWDAWFNTAAFAPAPKGIFATRDVIL